MNYLFFTSDSFDKCDDIFSSYEPINYEEFDQNHHDDENDNYSSNMNDQDSYNERGDISTLESKIPFG